MPPRTLVPIKLLLIGLLPLAVRAAPPVPEAVAPGVFAVLAKDDAPTPANAGFTANGGFIVGPGGVVVINPGPNRVHAEALARAIARVTPLPVQAVIDTQARPEQVLGTGYFAEQGVAVLAHPDTARLMEERCKRCLALLREQAGTAAMEGTRIVLPRPTLADGQVIDPAGRRLLIVAPAHAAIAGDTAVLDLESGVLFTGALVSLDHIPDLREADLAGLAAALERLAALPLRRVVPDRGPVAAPPRLAEFLRYIRELRQKTEQAYAAGTSLSDLEAAVGLPEFSAWAGYAEHHAANARALYLKLEKADLEGR